MSQNGQTYFIFEICMAIFSALWMKELTDDEFSTQINDR